MKPTNSIALSAGQDAGNRNMKTNGRNKWNEDDWNTASKIANELIDTMEKELL